MVEEGRWPNTGRLVLDNVLLRFLTDSAVGMIRSGRARRMQPPPALPRAQTYLRVDLGLPQTVAARLPYR
jgi:hypothetical protein